MVSFVSADHERLDLEFRAAPRAVDGVPYNGRQVDVVEGSAVEWLELVTT